MRQKNKSAKLSEIYHAPASELFHAIIELFPHPANFETEEKSIRFYEGPLSLPIQIPRNFDPRNIVIKLLSESENETEIRSGPKCTRKFFDQVKSVIEEEVLKTNPSTGRKLILSGVPITGYFKYRTEFQILPPPADAPKPKGILDGPHPVLLEFRFDKSSVGSINNRRIMKKSFESSSLLTLFLDIHIWTRDFKIRREWVYCIDDNPRVFKLCDAVYDYRFSPENEYADFKDIKDYKPLDVPLNLTELFDKAFSLERAMREKLMKVAHLFLLALKLWDISETAAYLATVNTIESIVPPSNERCPTCKSHLGITKTFKKFMEDHTSASNDPLIEKIKNNIYKTRSGIAHQGILFGSDRNPYWHNFFEEEHRNEGHILRYLVREAIINWFNDIAVDNRISDDCDAYDQ
ncbi:MAG: hypothetical protein M0Z48_03815 [Nitrospiraceae bacterium]|nr:hypothetical protein [Nitrospiraceae bacterium]